MESSPVNPKKSGKKYEDYELDNHVRTMQDAGKIAGDPHLKKAVLKHAKKKKAELHKVSKMMGEDLSSEEMSEASEDEGKEVKDMDGIRERKKKLKSKMSPRY